MYSSCRLIFYIIRVIRKVQIEANNNDTHNVLQWTYIQLLNYTSVIIHTFQPRLLTAVGLSPGGSTHLHTNNTYNITNNNQTTQITNNVEECGPCLVLCEFFFSLHLPYNRGKCTTTEEKARISPLHFTSLHFISFRFISLHFISLHFISLHFTSLHFTSFHFMFQIPFGLIVIYSQLKNVL